MVADTTDEAEVARMSDEVGASIISCRPPEYCRLDDPIGSTDMEGARSLIDNKMIGAVMLAKHAARTLREAP